jgi:hypothetical protein
MKKVLLIAAALMVAATPVWADSVHIGDTTTITNAPVANASAAAAASSSSSSSATAVNEITNINSQSQGQKQGQSQYQGQGQLQGQAQNNKQTISPSQDVHIKAEPLIPGSAPSPGLTSVGTYACLGSISFGLSGPLAGASFGITKVDKGCEHARDAVILMQWGYKEAALKLLTMNEDTALAVNGPATVKTSAVVAPAGAVPLAQVTGQNQAEATSACGKGMVVTPSGFCRWAK